MTPDAPKPAPKKPIAKKSGDKGINKSAEIRRVASGMKTKGEKPRPKTIMEILKKDGIVVSSPQVSMVLKKMGFRPRKRRKSSEVAPKVAPGTTAKKTTKIKVDDLVKAQKVAASMGGIDKALAALKALKDFEG
jgi:hypothetical protein